MSFRKYNAYPQPLFKNLNLLNISNIYKFEVGKYMHRVQSNQNLTLFNKYKQTSKLHKYETRLSSQNNFVINRAQTELRKKQMQIKGPNI